MEGRIGGLLSALLAAIALAACGGSQDGGGSGMPGTPGFTVGGSVSGLGQGKNASLQMNGGSAVTVSGNGAYSFDGRVQTGFAYSVAVLIQPLGETCVVGNPSGTVGSADVTSVSLSCSPLHFSVGGTVSGLAGSVTLQNNGADTLVVSAAGFTFPTPIADSARYAVTVSSQPAGQTCTVNNGRGVVTAADVANVAVICSATAHTVGGTLTGTTGTVVLRNNGADDLTLTVDGPFAFAASVATGAAYSVAVLTPPAGQGCSVANGSGGISVDVANVAVTCTANAFGVGGAVSGLSGTLALQNNGGDNLSVSSNGPFAFATALASGSPYAVSVLTKPAAQTCLVASPSGLVSGASIVNVAVTCGVPDLIPVSAGVAQPFGLGSPVFAILNAGNAGTVASPVSATVRLHTDSACESAPVSSFSAAIGALAPGAVGSVSTPGATVPAGTYPSQSLTVDPANAVAESNEGNNTRCLTTPLVVHQ
jgi:CARDB